MQRRIPGVNLIVRAVIVHEGHVLLTTTTKNNTEFASDLYFLPGGHVDYKEPAAEALKREIKEEMEIEIKDLDFIGALECSWNRKGQIYQELNLVYTADIENLCLKNPPVAVDPFHQFVWKPLSEMSTYKILPDKLIPLILETAFSKKEKSLFLSQMLPTSHQAV